MKEDIKLLREVANWLETPAKCKCSYRDNWNWPSRLKNIAREMEITENFLEIPEILKRKDF